MRASVLVAAVLVVGLLPGAPTASAAPLLTDAKGDVAYPTAAGPVGASTQATDGADLLALDLVESADDLAFTLTLASTSSTMGVTRMIYFTWNGVAYRVYSEVFSSEFGGSANGFAWLERYEDEDYEAVGDVETAADATSITFTVPRAYVLDRDERPPFRGGELADVYVEARMCCQIRISGNGAQATDLMPDDVAQGATFALALGEQATGNVRLEAPDPIRVSNGGATTFVFKIDLANKGEKDDEYELAIVDLPDGWNATVQSPVSVDGGEEKSLSVLASVPFEHKHGGFDSFNVTAVSTRDPGSRATTRLGVVHTPIPQPAGHHPDLFLHARPFEGGFFGEVFSTAFEMASGTMNTDSARADGEVETVTQNWCGSDGCGWFIPLEPALAMGLDFDLARTGTLVGALSAGSTGEGTIAAQLFVYRQGDEDWESVALAKSKPVPVALDMQSPAPFTMELVPTQEADYVPYAPDQNLYLEILLESDGVQLFGEGPTSPSLRASDFKLTLPLNEYHDRLTGFDEGESETLSLVADGPVEKAGRPGSTLAYAFTLENGGSEELAIDVDVAGTDAELGSLVPWGSVTLAAGESRKVTLAVGIPFEAAEGQVIEVIVFAHAEADPSIMALARTSTTVTLSEEATPDETDVVRQAQEEENRDTPAAGGLAALAVLALVAVAWNRR